MAQWLGRNADRSGFAEIQRGFTSMLEDGRHIFDAAANALIGGTDPETIRKDLFDTDARINHTEQQIRRQIVVHGTVHGVQSFPSLLVTMSLAKDAERIGDYAKNLFDLAARGPALGTDDEVRKLIEVRDQVSRLLGKARDLYETQDDEGARQFLARGRPDPGHLRQPTRGGPDRRGERGPAGPGLPLHEARREPRRQRRDLAGHAAGQARLLRRGLARLRGH